MPVQSHAGNGERRASRNADYERAVAAPLRNPSLVTRGIAVMSLSTLGASSITA